MKGVFSRLMTRESDKSVVYRMVSKSKDTSIRVRLSCALCETNGTTSTIRNRKILILKEVQIESFIYNIYLLALEKYFITYTMFIFYQRI